MTLSEAARRWRELGLIQMRNFGDHVCAAPMAPHTMAECPAAPQLVFTAEEVAGIEDDAGLNELLARKIKGESQ